MKSLMKVAYNLPWQESMAKLRKQGDWLPTHYPGAASSLWEGLEETFTIDLLELSPALRRCLGSTNIIESLHARGDSGPTGWAAGGMDRWCGA